jgi:hypothetical protein
MSESRRAGGRRKRRGFSWFGFGCFENDGESQSSSGPPDEDWAARAHGVSVAVRVALV